jgi:hypothetical protein
MSKNSGIGFSTSVQIGIFIENINRRVDRLYPHIESGLMMHNLYETFPTKDNSKYFKENFKHLLLHVENEVEGINKQIKAANKILRLLMHGKEILPIDYHSIKIIIEQRFADKLKEKKPQELGNENLKLKIDNVITKTRKSVFVLVNYFEEVEAFSGQDKLSKRYWGDIGEAIAIFSFGFLNTALFVLGRTLESVLDDALKKLMSERKIERIILSKTKYESKIGILKSKNFIDERLFHELNTIRYR